MELLVEIGSVALAVGAVMWLVGDIVGRRTRAKNAKKYGRK